MRLNDQEVLAILFVCIALVLITFIVVANKCEPNKECFKICESIMIQERVAVKEARTR